MSKNKLLYVKQGRRYYPIEGDGFMPSDGIWLVNLNGSSKRRIAKLSEFSEKNQEHFFSMHKEDYDDLLSFLYLKRKEQILRTISIEDNSIRWEEKNNADLANDIISFLSKDKNDRKEFLQKIRDDLFTIEKEWLHGNGCYAIRNSSGDLIASFDDKARCLVFKHSNVSQESLEKEIKQTEEKLAILKKYRELNNGN